MPGAEAAFDALVAIVIGAVIVIRVRQRRAGRDVPLAVPIATGGGPRLVAVLVGMIAIVTIPGPG